MDNYYFDGGQCLICVIPCLNCMNLNTCLSFQDNFYYESQQCINCVSPCKKCSSESICIDCVGNYYFDGSQCKSCISPCLNCINQSKCLSCIENYYFDNQECQSFPSPCQKCSSQSVCIDCQDNYYFYGWQCLSCVSPFKNFAKIISIQIIKSLKVAQVLAKNALLQIVDKYFFQGGQFLSCVSPCLDWNAQVVRTHFIWNNNHQAICSDFILGYYIQDSDCIQCKQNCLECLDGNSCNKCQINHYFFDQQCQVCQSTCVDCQSLNYCCITCISGYQEQGLCVQFQYLVKHAHSLIHPIHYHCVLYVLMAIFIKMVVFNVIQNVNFALINTFALHVILDRIENYKTNHVCVLMVFKIVVVNMSNLLQSNKLHFLLIELLSVKQLVFIMFSAVFQLLKQCIDCNPSTLTTFDSGTCICQIHQYFIAQIFELLNQLLLELNFQQFNNGICKCDIGYSDISVPICQNCSYKCLACSCTITNCISCSVGSQRSGSLCSCAAGYFDDGPSSNYMSCPLGCKFCASLKNCTSCQITRKLTSGLCTCIQG
ncbi:hypothetical protein pb186bvf_005720, partial [Paramecium bursaria]